MSQLDDSRAPQNTTQAVREEAADTTAHARDAAKDVAGTAREQARSVVEETGTQAKNVLSDVRAFVESETDDQTRRLSAAVRQWSTELDSMAGQRENDSTAKQIVRGLARNGQRAADYLDGHSSRELLGEVRDFARRRPGTFLIAAALGGLAVGRLAKAGTPNRQPATDEPAMPPPETSSSMLPPPATESPRHADAVRPTAAPMSPLPDEVTR